MTFTIGLPPGGSSTVHIYTQAVHRTTQWNNTQNRTYITIRIHNITTKFSVRVTVHRNKFLCNKINQMHWFHKFILSLNSTCFGQFVCPSSGVYSLYTQQDQDRTAVPSCSCSKAVYKHVWHIPLLSVQWINSWWWTEELSETCRVSWQINWWNWCI